MHLIIGSRFENCWLQGTLFASHILQTTKKINTDYKTLIHVLKYILSLKTQIFKSVHRV